MSKVNQNKEFYMQYIKWNDFEIYEKWEVRV